MRKLNLYCWLMVLLVTLFFFNCVEPSHAEIPTDGLVAYYPFNGNANDESGNGNHGTVYGATLVQDRFGNDNSAYSFDGIDDYIDYGTSSTLNFEANAPFTIAGWIKTTDNYGTIISQRNSVEGGAVIDVTVGYDGAYNNDPGKLLALVRQNAGGDGSQAVVKGELVNDDSWHHFVLTRNSGNQIELFIDSISQGTSSNVGSGGAITTDLRALGCERKWVLIGFASADMRWLNGNIDDVRIYNRALSEAEIQELYHEAGLVGYWKFDEGSGTTAYDSVGANHGTIHGATWTTGIVGGALSFDGNDYIVVSNHVSLGITGELTIEAWTETSSTAHDQTILEKGGWDGTGNGEYALLINEWPSYSGKGRFQIYEATPPRYVDTTEPLNDGSWHHIVGVWDGSSLKIFVDGKLDNYVETTGKLTADNEDLIIGSRYGRSCFFVGTIDELAIYNRALTPEEIQQHYQNVVRPMLHIASHLPDGAVNQPVSYVDVTFNESITSATFTADDISMTGPYGSITVNPPVNQGGNVWRISFPEQFENGEYHIYIGPRIEDLDGNELDQDGDGTGGEDPDDIYDASFTIDTTPPYITGHSPSGQVHYPVNYVDVTFNESINAATFTADDISLTGPAGLIPVNPPIKQNGNVWRIGFELQDVEGDYTISVGPDIKDLAGNAMIEAYGGSFTIAMPDLVVSNVGIPFEAWTSQQIDVSWTVTNIGAAPTIGNWQDCIYLSGDGQIGGDTKLGCLDRPVGLGTGEFYDRVGTVTIPGVTGGYYWIIVKVDDGTALAEPDETNNDAIVGSFPIHVMPLPDLEPSGLVIPTEPIAAGSTAYADWAVTNIGDGATNAPFWFDRIYLSTDQSLDGSDRAINDFQNPMALNPGEAYSQSVQFTVPGDLGGNYYVIVKTDSQGTQGNVSESNENNNIVVSVTTMQIQHVIQPILTVTNVQVDPSNPYSGDSITVTWTLTNTGEASTGPFTIDHAVVLSTDDILNYPGDQVLDWHVGELSASLQPGETSAPISASVNIPWDIWGNYYIIVWPDPPQWVDLDREPGSAQIQVQPGLPSDLVVDSVVIPSTGLSGQPIHIAWTVRNASSEPTRVTTWKDKVYLSVDDDFGTTGDNILLETFTHSGALGFDETYTREADVVLPVTASGTYHIFVHTDADNSVFESTWEDNNVGSTTTTTAVTYAPPDLVVSSVTVLMDGSPSASVPSGSSVTVQWEVTNSGSGDVPNTSWHDRIYVSQDEILDSGDRVLASPHHYDSLTVGGSYNGSADVTIPTDITGQTIYIFVCTDVNNQVHESNNDNNCQVAAPFEVAWCNPDLTVNSISASQGVPVGEAINVSWSVKNIGGPTVVETWYDKVYLSDNHALDSSDIELGDFAHTGILNYQQSYSNNQQNIPIPPGLSGTYYVIMETDTPNPGVVSELNENNNTGYAAIPLNVGESCDSDLVVSSVDAPATAISGQLMTINWTVTNQGEGTTNKGSWGDVVYLSRDQYLDRDSDIYAGYLNHSGFLPTGDSYDPPATLDIRIPQGLSGPYYVFIATDSNNGVCETDESNNEAYNPAAVNVELPPQSDLVVTNIVVPSTGLLGESVTIQWTVRNDSDIEARGSWHDSVYISADTTWDMGDKKIGNERHTGSLPAGTEYTESLTAKLPGVIPGNYYIIVRTDIYNEVRETTEGEQNNITTSTAQINVDCWQLTLGVPDSSHQLSTGTEHYYKILNVPEGEDLLITLDCADDSASTELYVRYGAIPDSSHYDFAYSTPFAADHEIVVPSSHEGTYYVLVRGENILNSAVIYTLNARLLEFEIFSIEPDHGGNIGTVTICIRGSKFTPETVGRLAASEGTVIAEGMPQLITPTKMFFSFDLRGAPEGVYSVEIEKQNETPQTLEDAFEVMPGVGPILEAHIIVPQQVRPAHEHTIWVNYANVGDTDLFVPVFEMTTSTYAKTRLQDSSSNWGNSTSFIGLSAEGPVGLLSPGSENRIPLSFVATQTETTVEFMLRSPTGSSDPIPWATIETDIRSKWGGEVPNWWETFWPDFQEAVGSTWNDWQESIARLATFLLISEVQATHDYSYLLRYQAAKCLIKRYGPQEIYNPTRRLWPRCFSPEELRNRAEATRYYTHRDGNLVEIFPSRDRDIFRGEDVLIVGYGWDHSDWGAAFAEEVLQSDVYSNYQVLVVAPDEAFGIADNPVRLDEAVRNRQYVADVVAHAAAEFGIDPERTDIYAHSIFHEVGLLLLDHWQEQGHPTNLFVSMDGFWSTYTPDVDTDIVTIRTSPIGITVNYGDWHIEVEGQSHSAYLWIQNNLDLIQQLLNQYPDGGWFYIAEDGTVYVREEAPEDYLFWTGQMYVYVPTGLVAGQETRVVQPIDPNEKIGFSGFGGGLFASTQIWFQFTVHFENVPDATAPAQQITITDQLSSNLDWRTFQLGEIAFGDKVVEIPERRGRYLGEVNLDNGLIARISAGLNIQTGIVTWTLTAIDPETGEMPENPLLGLLPPNDPETHCGEGHVTFFIRPNPDLPTGTEITNRATIIFDNNEPIETNEVFNTIDADAPSSAVDPLPSEMVQTTFTLTWSGQDVEGGSGLASYDIYVSDNGGVYTPWQGGVTETSGTFTGEAGHNYRFYSLARDNAGNVEAPPSAPDAATTLLNLAASNPNPADGAEDISALPSLSWDAGYAADTHDVYIWQEGDVKPDVPIVSGLTQTTYTLSSPLLCGTTYHWQVVENSSYGDTPGPIWRFTTFSADGDPDQDGLPNQQEITIGSDPFNPDTDGDGYSDGEEVDAGSDPTNPSSIPNQPPVANAGPDQNVMTDKLVTLDGSGSYDPERALITFLWTFVEVPEGSSVIDNSLSDVTSAKPTFTPDVDGTYVLKLTVSDGVRTSVDEVAIYAATFNVAPNANAGRDQNVLTGPTVYLDGSKSEDPDSGPEPLSYLWSFDSVPEGSFLIDDDIIDRDQVNASFIPDEDGSYVSKLAVSDGDLTSEDTVEIMAIPFDVPPNANAGEDITIYLCETATLDGSASNDPDDGPEPLSYSWWFVSLPEESELTNEDISGADTVSPSFAPDVSGTYVIRLMVSDGQGYSCDNVAVMVVVDTTPPEVEIKIPQPNQALQDGVTFGAEASDVCGVTEVYFYLREPGDIPIGYDELPATFNDTSGKWEYDFDTTKLQDGYYIIMAKAVDTNGNEGWSEMTPFSIRNWAVVELLPASKTNKAGRTMPVKFSLRIASSVDPEQPFVYNEELEIRIYKVSPDKLLQTSTYGDHSTDYRIDTSGELYITNFKTDKKPASYRVEIWRMSKNFKVGEFTFETVK